MEDSPEYVVAVHEPIDQGKDPLLRILQSPIAFHRIFVDLTGSVLAALMLSQMFYWSGKGTNTDGWIYKTRQEWEEETGMGRREQETARKKLRTTTFWQERKAGVPAKLYYRIHMPNLKGEVSAQLGWRNPPNKDGGIRPTNTESTSENTTTTTVDDGGKEVNIRAATAFYNMGAGVAGVTQMELMLESVAEHGIDAFEQACRIAAKAPRGCQTLRYVDGILKRDPPSKNTPKKYSYRIAPEGDATLT